MEYSVTPSLLCHLRSLDEQPLFCENISKIMTMTNDGQKCLQDVQFVDKESLKFTKSSLTAVVESLLASDNNCELSLTDQVTKLLPFCHDLSLKCHSVIQGASDTEVVNCTASDLHKLVWSGCKLTYLISDCPVERAFGIISVTARLEWIFSCLDLQRRLQLKDNLMSTQIKAKLGSLAIVFQCILGCVNGFNVKNLAWHGFVSPSNVPKEICSLLYCAIMTLNAKDLKIKKRIPMVLSSVEMPKIPEFSLDMFDVIIRHSSLIHPEHQDEWLKLIDTSGGPWESESLLLTLSVNVALLQHCLRRLWVIMTQTNPSRCTAQNEEFYITLDEIFSPAVHPDVPRPGASYFSTVYNKEQLSNSTEHVLIPVLGKGTFYALLDLFVHGEGLRLRDKLSHFECHAVEEDLVKHVLFLSMSILARFCERHVLADCCVPILDYCNNYRHQFHPTSMINNTICRIDLVLGKLSSFVVESAELSARVDESVTKLLARADSFGDQLVESSKLEKTAPLFIGPDKMKYYNLLQAVLQNMVLFLEDIYSGVNSKFEKFREHELRSRQRDNLMTILGLLPAFIKIISLSRGIINLSVASIESLTSLEFDENVQFVKLLKGTLKCFENCVSHAKQSKWQEMSRVLLDYLECWGSAIDNNLF